MRLTAPVVLAVTLFSLLPSACSRPAHQDEVPTSCSKVGQSCSLPPGKLGSCVAPVSCTTPDCLVCQSQH